MKDGQKARNMEARKVIQSRGNDPRSDKQFFFEIQDAILGGWRVAQNSRRDDACSRNIFGTGQVVLYKDGQEFLEDMKSAVSTEETEVSSETEEESEQAEVELKETDQENSSEEDLNLTLEGLTKKAELLAFAAEREIEVSQDLKSPAAIKKFLKTQIK